MRRIASLLLPLAFAGALGACDLEITGFDGGCVISGCSTGQTPPEHAYSVLGFPDARVDRTGTTPDGGYRGRLAVGDSFTLHLVNGPRDSLASSLRDTIRFVEWEVTDSVAASITSGPGGAGVFRAKAPGAVRIAANRMFPALWACRGKGCSRVSEVFITR